jgi:hypothetical protein
MNKFFILSQDLFSRICCANLSAGEYKVWLYLSLKDPFGVRLRRKAWVSAGAICRGLSCFVTVFARGTI